MIEWHLDRLCKQQKLKTKMIVELTGLKPETIRRHRRQSYMPLRISQYLEAYCKALQCTPGDLLK